MKAVSLAPNILGVDTVAKLAPYECRALVNLGFKFREGYLDALDVQEVQGQLGEGLPLVLYTYANQFDPEHILARLAALGIPTGVSVVLDLEALPSDADVSQVCDRIDNCGEHLQSQGFLPCLYYAAGSLLTSDELYERRVYRYHAGASINRDRKLQLQEPLPRGCAMIQGRPVNFTLDAIPGKRFDADFHRQDYKGDVFMAVST